MIDEYIHHEDPRRRRVEYLPRRIRDRLDNDLKLFHPNIVSRMDRYMGMLSREDINSTSYSIIMDSVNELIRSIDHTRKRTGKLHREGISTPDCKLNSQKYSTEKEYQDVLEAGLVDIGYELTGDTSLSFGIPDIIARKNGVIYIIECKLNGIPSSYSGGLGQSLFYRECIPGAVSVFAIPDMPRKWVIDIFNSHNIQVITKASELAYEGICLKI